VRLMRTVCLPYHRHLVATESRAGVMIKPLPAATPHAAGSRPGPARHRRRCGDSEGRSAGG